VLFSDSKSTRISVDGRVEESLDISTDVLLRVVDEAAAGMREPQRWFVEAGKAPGHIAGWPGLWSIVRRIYGDRARLFPAILARMSHPNKLPLGGSYP
jgi:hypothetical protein